MDAFWFIPFAIVLVTLVCVIILLLKRLPEAPNNPRVLVDKPSETPAVEESIQARDWSTRPCGSYLEWLSEVGNKPAK